MPVQPVPSHLFRDIRKCLLYRRPPYFEGRFIASAILELRREMFRIIVHSFPLRSKVDY